LNLYFVTHVSYIFENHHIMEDKLSKN